MLRLITIHSSLITVSGGSSSVVERQPSKLRVAGSNPVSRSRSKANVIDSVSGCREKKGFAPPALSHDADNG
jgi:hypothetical protein